MKKILFILIPIVSSFSQNKNDSINFTGNLHYNNIKQEKFFIHTNKTIYFAGEEVWWKAYIVSDFNNNPTTNTSNLHLNFYDNKKKLISSNLFFCKEGKAHGTINTSKKLTSGTYYIQPDTQWNKNFHKPYLLPITIINLKENNTFIDTFPNQKKLRINLYPESGGVLEGFRNTFFCDLKKGNQFLPNTYVSIMDDTTNKKITNFKTNKFGLGKFSLFYKSQHTYSAIINEGGNKRKIRIFLGKDSAIIIKKQTKLETIDSQTFLVLMSKNEVLRYNNKKIYALIHRNNKLLYTLPFNVKKNANKYLLKFNKNDLFYGTNTLTLFNDKNQVIAKRNFFIRNKDNINFEIKTTKTTKDSIILNIKLKNYNKKTNVSISVLPKNTLLNKNHSNIFSDFLFNPYVDYRIPLIRNLSNSDLDLLLQTKPLKKSKSNFDLIKPFYSFEEGISIKGSINTPIKAGYKILLSSKANNILKITSINKDSSFEFKNLVMQNSSNYKLAVLNKKGAIIKAGIYASKSNLKYTPSDLLLAPSKKNDILIKMLKETNKHVNNNILLPESKFDLDNEVLDEVTVNGKIREKDVTPLYPNMPNQLGNGFTRKLKFDEHQKLNMTLIQFINNQVGIKATEYPLGAKIAIQRGPNTFFGEDSRNALVIIDGTPSSADALSHIPLSQIASIKVNSSGAGYGMRGAGGVVLIDFKRKNETTNTTTNKNFFESEIDFGFTESKSSFTSTPLIFKKNTQSKLFFEALDWIPNLNLLPNKVHKISIHKGEHNSITLFINGMSDSGQLLYDEIQLKL
ncbi:hypothetical protein [Tenacibaculum aestuarii]|uniref:hypothetical protein n=1 Tax=Tenacibaculum aestuarii TaxID=362781 RepID=UPI003892EDB1